MTDPLDSAPPESPAPQESPATQESPPPDVVQAAGVICWRPAERAGRAGPSGLEVLLVHRPRYDDWSWPKGKVEPGETLPECAVRETAEETGVRALLGLPLTALEYPLPDGRHKRVTYWAGRAARSGQRTASASEVDQVQWLAAEQARERLTRPADAGPLDVLLRARQDGVLAARPVLVVRHATARPRDSWARADADRPLVASGRRQALALTALLTCWRPDQVLSSPWRRCAETLAPYLAASGARMRTKGGLTEDGFRRDPTKAGKHIARLLRRDGSSLLCTHRPVLGAVLEVLRLAADPEPGQQIPGEDPYLAPGEVLVAHTLAGPHGPRIVAVERHVPFR